MDATERRRRVRAILAGEACVHPASVHDPLSARIAEELGFELGMLAGSTAALAVLGAPDLILLTLSEFADLARRITRAGALPLLCDADHGYGNALNAMRTVAELEHAGVAALSIEDTDLPRPFGRDGTRLLPIGEGVGKVRAALAARSDPATVILARTGAVGITGLDDALARARAYAATDADGLFLTGVTRRAELDAIAGAVRLPLVLGTLSPALADRDYLAARGVRIALQGHLPFAAAVQAIQATMAALRAGTPPDAIAGLPPAGTLQRLSREDVWQAATQAHLKPRD